MRIVFVQPNVGFRGHTWEALGIGYLAAYLRKYYAGELDIDFYSGFYDNDEQIIEAGKDADLIGFSCSVYGASETPGVRLTEDSPVNPASLYAEMKLKSEKGIMEAMDDNFSPTILRMATLYGLSPRMRFDLVINSLTAKAVTEGKITIFGGNQWRPLVHVDDAAEAYIRCLETPIDEVRGQVFNVGSNQQNYKILELGSILQSIIPNVQIENRDELTDERNYSAAFDKISNVLGYTAERTIQDGIAEVKHAFDEGIIGDYTDKRYSNYESLSEEVPLGN